MDAIESTTIQVGGLTYRVSIYPDEDAPNPLDDWSEMGTILSLNRRHRNFNPVGIDAAIATDPDAVPLSYYEHGSCLWSVHGEQPASCRCPWDSVPFAGVWLPDRETLATAAHYGGRTRQIFMRKRAHQACDAYSQWCNGDIYGYRVERVTVCASCNDDHGELIDSCWGVYGREACVIEAKAIVARHAGLAASEQDGWQIA